jgi:hypothetical protein
MVLVFILMSQANKHLRRNILERMKDKIFKCRKYGERIEDDDEVEIKGLNERISQLEEARSTGERLLNAGASQMDRVQFHIRILDRCYDELRDRFDHDTMDLQGQVLAWRCCQWRGPKGLRTLTDRHDCSRNKLQFSYLTFGIKTIRSDRVISTNNLFDFVHPRIAGSGHNGTNVLFCSI